MRDQTETTEPPAQGKAGKPKRQFYGRTAKRGIAWSFMREVGTEIIGTPVALILARLLTPFDFGVAASAAFFVTLAARLTNFGFNLALARIKVLRPEHSSSVFVVVLGIGAVAYIVLASSGQFMAEFFHAPQLVSIMPVAALGFLITPFGSVPAALMTRDLKFRESAICDWASGIAGAMTSVPLAFMGFGYWALVYNQVSSDIVGTTAKIILSGWRPRFHFSRTAIKELLSFGTGVFFKRLLDYASNNGDNLVVGRMLGVSALGFYDKGFVTMRRILTRLNTGGPAVSFQVLSKMQDEPERFRKAYRKISVASALLSFPALLGLATIGPDLIPVMYGHQWAPTIVPFQVLCVSGAFTVLTDYVGAALQSMGRIWGQVTRQVVHASLIIILVAVFSRWGLPGAACGVLIATVTMYVLMQSLLMRLTSLPARLLFQLQIPGLLCGLGVVLTVSATRWVCLEHVASAPQWMRLMAELLAGGSAYLAFIKFNRFSDVRGLIQEVASDAPPRFARVARLFA